MNFSTIKNTTTDIRYSGIWPPMFKGRLQSHYNTSNCIEYERDLFSKIFDETDDIIVVRPNDYPNIGPTDILDQYVIWIRESSLDPGIDAITNIVSNKFPDFDYIVFINGEADRSIKSILHYHAVIRPRKSITDIKLEKLIIYHRHANRYPIIKFKLFEPLVASQPVVLSSVKTFSGQNPQLLPIGVDNSIQFARNLIDAYSPHTKAFYTAGIYTSPRIRCQATSRAIIDSLKECSKSCIITGYKDVDILCPLTLTDIKSSITKYIDLNQETIDKINVYYDQYYDMITLFENIVGTSTSYASLANSLDGRAKALSYLYDYYSALECYEDIGIDISSYICPTDLSNLKGACKHVHNFLFDLYRIPLTDYLNDVIATFDCNEDIVSICSTHDTLITLLLKHFAHINGINTDFELSGYLSNIRLEGWSDKTVRVFYGSLCLGSKIFV